MEYVAARSEFSLLSFEYTYSCVSIIFFLLVFFKTTRFVKQQRKHKMYGVTYLV